MLNEELINNYAEFLNSGNPAELILGIFKNAQAEEENVEPIEGKEE